MNADEKYQFALKRNIQEVVYSLSNINIVNAIYETFPLPHKFDFFYYSSLSLYKDSISRAIKVLENKLNDNTTLSFWYLYKTKKSEIENFCFDKTIDINDFFELSEKLKHLRDKLFFHIDKSGVASPKQIWKNADINGDFYISVLKNLFKILEFLYELQFNKKSEYFIFDAKDVKEIMNRFHNDDRLFLE